MYGNPHVSNSSYGWNVSQGGDLPALAGQQPLGGALYVPAGSFPNTYVACNPSTAVTPQPTHSQATEPRYLTQIPEKESSDHEVDSDDSATDFESAEQESNSGSEMQG